MGPLSRQEIVMSKRITDYSELREAIPAVVRRNCPHPKRWLDTGCGMGGSSRLNIESFPDTEFYLADPSEENLTEARGITDRGDGSCHYKLGTSDSLDFGDGTFDVVTAILCHHYYPDPSEKMRATRNCLRMLRSGGIFVVVEHTVHDEGQEEMDRQWRSYMEDAGLGEESIQEMFDRRGTAYFPMTDKEYIVFLEDAGFTDVKQFWKTCSDMGFVARRP